MTRRLSCRTYLVDGEPVVVRGDRELDAEAEAALAELVAVARRRLAAETPPAAASFPVSSV